jgi:hypothetical protein
MASSKRVLHNLLFHFGGYRISREANRLLYTPQRSEQDVSGFEDETDQTAKGTHANKVEIAGVPTGELELELFTQLLASADRSLTACLRSGSAKGAAPVGSETLTLLVDVSGAPVGGDRNTPGSFTASLFTNYQMYYGALLYNDVGGAGTTAAGAKAGYAAGALGAGQVLAWDIAVLEPPGIGGTGGPQATITLESDVDNTWAAPATRLSASVFAAPGSQLLTLDGDTDPVTDTWWRINVTGLTGTDPVVYLLASLTITTKI